jgi:SAM-dependent methyltransferase
VGTNLLEGLTDKNCFQGFQLANNTEKTMFDFFEDHPERMSRFKDAMAFLQTFPGLEPSYAVKAYDWASLGKATVVDVGGSHGLVCIALAKEFPDLQFVVQDLPKVIEDAKTKSPADLSNRVTFQAHDFFEEQPVKNADIYYFRWILHDWSDKYCVKILRALIPALKPGARLLFSERCLEAPCTLPLRAEKWNR